MTDSIKFPTWYLDQDELWLGTDGVEHRISHMTDEFVMWALDWALANATEVRASWSMDSRQSYDTNQKARRWMLERPVIRALMKQLVVPRASLREQGFEVALRQIVKMPYSGWLDQLMPSRAREIAQEALDNA